MGNFGQTASGSLVILWTSNMCGLLSKFILWALEFADFYENSFHEPWILQTFIKIHSTDLKFVDFFSGPWGPQGPWNLPGCEITPVGAILQLCQGPPFGVRTSHNQNPFKVI